MLELFTAYTAFANNGIVSHPIAVLKVVDEKNQILRENRLNQQAVLRADIAFLLTDMLKNVITDGTGSLAKVSLPAAGKTGTTDNYETAWFIGYTPELLVGIYTGNDDRTPIGLAGGNIAAMWGKMLNKLTYLSKNDFTVPDNIVTNIPVCTNSGLLPGISCPEIEYDAFISGTQPRERDNWHNKDKLKTRKLLPLFGLEKQVKGYVEYGIIFDGH